MIKKTSARSDLRSQRDQRAALLSLKSRKIRLNLRSLCNERAVQMSLKSKKSLVIKMESASSNLTRHRYKRLLSRSFSSSLAVRRANVHLHLTSQRKQRPALKRRRLKASLAIEKTCVRSTLMSLRNRRTSLSGQLQSRSLAIKRLSANSH